MPKPHICDFVQSKRVRLFLFFMYACNNKDEEETYMPILIKPELIELDYRRRLHGHLPTMKFAHGTENFPNEQWKQFYKNTVNADPGETVYRLVFCEECAEYVGEAGYHFDHSENKHMLDLIIGFDKRSEGYGNAALKLLEDEAVSNHVSCLYTRILKDNPAYTFLTKRGFTEVSETDDDLLLMKQL